MGFDMLSEDQSHYERDARGKESVGSPTVSRNLISTKDLMKRIIDNKVVE